MTVETWSTDEAVVILNGSADELGSLWRYGVTDWEASHPEPFDLTLAQEQPDLEIDGETDEQWELFEDADRQAGRLIADDLLRDDDFAIAVDDPDDYAPEELAIHLVEADQ